MGGKALSASHILDILNHPAFDNMEYLEPFVGYAHILRRVVNKSRYIGSDKNELLITLLKHIQKSGKYPHITKSEYDRLKHSNSKVDQLKKAFAAFTYSYNGIEFASYAGKTPARNYANERKRYYDKLRTNPQFMSVELYCASYDQLKPNDMLIYCDPPYDGTSKYNTQSCGKFDHTKFWNVMRLWSKNNIVFISEYTAPSDFIIISEKTKRSTIARYRKVDDIRTEKLYIHKSVFNKIKSIFTKS